MASSTKATVQVYNKDNDFERIKVEKLNKFDTYATCYEIGYPKVKLTIPYSSIRLIVEDV